MDNNYLSMDKNELLHILRLTGTGRLMTARLNG